MIWFRGRKNCQRISENRRIKRSRESGFSLTRYLLWCVYHEIAHSVLHTNITAAFHEFTLFDDTDRQEYEANLFAAELLLSDDCVLNALNEDQFFFQAAKALYVPAELLDFKFRVMKRKGYKLESPIVSHGNFLKTIE